MRCSVCGKVFAGASAFDAHRVGEMPTNARVGEAVKHRRCLSAAEMRDIGLKRDRHNRWCRLTPIMAAEEEKEAA